MFAQGFVKVIINDDPAIIVNWPQNQKKNALYALEEIYLKEKTGVGFTYGIQVYKVGCLIIMINDIFETCNKNSGPFYYWELFYNGKPSTKGIDLLMLSEGDTIKFSLEEYNAEKHQMTTVGIKHASRMSAN